MLPWQTGSEPFSVMTQQQLYEWITHPELLNRDTLYELRTLLCALSVFSDGEVALSEESVFYCMI